MISQQARAPLPPRRNTTPISEQNRSWGHQSAARVFGFDLARSSSRHRRRSRDQRPERAAKSWPVEHAPSAGGWGGGRKPGPKKKGNNVHTRYDIIEFATIPVVE